MKDFADALADAIIANEMPKIDKVMNEVTKNIRHDFAEETYRLMDLYYETYEPIRYVRLHNHNGRGTKRVLRRNKGASTTSKPQGSGVSLYAAITRGGVDAPAIGIAGGSFAEGYIGGIIFDESYFRGNSMRHVGKGNDFTEWNIVENFLFAGKNRYGDWRSTSESGWSGESADAALISFMNSYDHKLKQHFKNALKNK